MMPTMKRRLTRALEQFLSSDEFFEGMIVATKASWSGSSGYVVELFEDGTWNILWNNQIGKKDRPLGIILDLPTLDDSTYQTWMAEFGKTFADREYWRFVYDRDGADLKENMRRLLENRLITRDH